MMPEIDGYSFTQKIKKDQLWNHIPVVLLSAMHYENNLIKGLNTGADAYVTKPFNPLELVARVKSQSLLMSIIWKQWLHVYCNEVTI